MSLTIAFLGIGGVGLAIADHLQFANHKIVVGARNANSDSVKAALAKNGNFVVKTAQEAVKEATVVFLATPYAAAKEVLESVSQEIKGKILVDCTNPIGAGLTHGLESKTSATKIFAALLPETHVVKSFNIYGVENFRDNSFESYPNKPSMFFCGDNAEAKKVVAGLISQLGWEPFDVGGCEQALELEHMCLMWVRYVRLQKGHTPFTVYSVMQK